MKPIGMKFAESKAEAHAKLKTHVANAEHDRAQLAKALSKATLGEAQNVFVSLAMPFLESVTLGEVSKRVLESQAEPKAIFEFAMREVLNRLAPHGSTSAMRNHEHDAMRLAWARIAEVYQKIGGEL